MRVWYFDENAQNPRDCCVLEASPQVTTHQLEQLQLKVIEFDADNYDSDNDFNKFKSDNKYDYQDIITVNGKTMPNYAEKVKAFLREHIHDDDEARAILDGCGYFDVKDASDKWIRVEVSKGDLLVVPAGIYHRFVPSTDDYIKVIRLFQGQPVWTPINRDEKETEIEASHVRINYLNSIKSE